MYSGKIAVPPGGGGIVDKEKGKLLCIHTIHLLNSRTVKVFASCRTVVQRL
jgi:hypothetical protein